MRLGRGSVIALATGSCLLLGLAFVPTLCLRLLASKAAARGFVVEAAEVGFRFGEVRFEELRLKHERLIGLTANLERLSVRVGVTGVGRIQLTGGQLKYVGELSALQKEFRAAKKKNGAPATGGGGRSFEVEGLALSWESGTGQAAHAWDVKVRRHEGLLSGSVRKLKLEHAAAEVVLSGVAYEIEWPEKVIQRLTAKRTQIELKPAGVDKFLKRVPAAQKSEPVVAKAAGSKNKQASAVPASKGDSWLSRFALDAERASRVRALIDSATERLASRFPEGGGFRLDAVTLKFHLGGKPVVLGPARFELNHHPGQIAIAFVPGYESEQSHELQVEVISPLPAGEVEFRVRGGPLNLAELGVKNGDLGLTKPGATRLNVTAHAKLSANAEIASFSSSGELLGISLSHPGLAEYPLSGIDLSWQGEGELHVDGSQLTIETAQLKIGAVGVEIELDVKRDAQHLTFKGKAEVPVASCDEMFQSLPMGLAPGLSGAALKGTFSWLTQAAFDTDKLGDMKIKWRMQNDCKFGSVPPDVDPQRFKQPFRLTVPDELGSPMQIWSGPGSSDWAPLHDVSRYMEVAVLVTEDARFWSHDGFDQGAIQSAIRQNINAGKYVRGASTISMQLSKNLYLSRSKVIARKVEEALLTMLLEQQLRKDQILELYLNVIEYAPGIFGVRAAAEYYFRSLPGELSVAQSFFLASVLPAPSHQHFEADGALKPRRSKYLRSLMQIAHRRKRLNAAELESGLAEVLQFGVPHEPSYTRAPPQDEGETF